MAKGGGRKGARDKYAENRKAILAGLALARAHPLIRPLPTLERWQAGLRFDGPALHQEADAWIQVRLDPIRPDRWAPAGSPPEEPVVSVWPNLRRREPPEHWAYVLARLRLHLVLDHLDPAWDDAPWHQACWCVAEELISGAGVGRRPEDLPPLPAGLPRGDAAERAARFRADGLRPEIERLSLGGPARPFWQVDPAVDLSVALRAEHAKAFARGIRAAATEAVDVAGGARRTLGAETQRDNAVIRARAWMISEYPLLAALASSFTLIQDGELCERMGVEVAAIHDAAREVYFHPRIHFSEGEARFVMAHEFLHAGLRHSERRQGRDPHLWNVACDYVINDWLIEMKLGDPPEGLGYLHDASLRGQSAEEVYDRIVRDLRWMRKLRKARGMNGGRPDMIENGCSAAWWRGGGADLDAFYRRALYEGLDLHRQGGRGLLPAGLVEEIRALQQPPIPWDVELAQWLDRFFPPLERRRTFARAHRRQSATPDIARAAWVVPEEKRAGRTFAAVIDTSGSMDRASLGKAVGAIASYALSRDVEWVRLVQCDAAAHDAGYVAPETLLDRIEVRGRGGTVLMPGIRAVECAEDFPDDGPILIITDGECDRLAVRHEHAFLLAHGGRLPFPPKGPVFQFA